MGRRRNRVLVAVAAVLVAATAVQIGRAALLPAPQRTAQWNLDVERAMDAIGLGPGMIVGEAGAGDGYFTLPMARRVGVTGEIDANDIDRKALDTLERRGKREGLANIRTVLGAVGDPLFPRRDLEIVVVVHAIHHFARPVEWLVNLKQYLRPGARLAVIDRDPAKGAGSHYWPRERIVGYADEAGYELVKTVDDLSDHIILLFSLRQAEPRPATAVRSLRPRG
jgi:ubiquinone/menaquinone biosynthesis C-methylase UbiE